jgi:hypothetical protein
LEGLIFIHIFFERYGHLVSDESEILSFIFISFACPKRNEAKKKGPENANFSLFGP